MSDGRIEIFLAVDKLNGDYFKFASVSIVSAVLNTSSPLNIHVITIDDSKTSQTADDIEQFVMEHGSTMTLHRIDPDELHLKDWMKRNIGTFIRLKAPEILECDKAIYLDGDIVVNKDLSKLWAVELGENYAAAVPDSKVDGIYTEKQIKSIFGKKIQYVNAGVMLFNLKLIRSEMDLLKDSVSFLEETKNAKMRDQDALNYLFRDRMTILDPSFNRFAVDIGDDDFDDTIIHYAGPKPWKVIAEECYKEYWRYFIKLPFVADKENVIEYSLPVTDFEAAEKALVDGSSFWDCLGFSIRVMKKKLLQLKSPANDPSLDRRKK